MLKPPMLFTIGKQCIVHIIVKLIAALFEKLLFVCLPNRKNSVKLFVLLLEHSQNGGEFFFFHVSYLFSTGIIT
nr:MAG TPA: hypothetical protein [Caudoviricetes sp.]